MKIEIEKEDYEHILTKLEKKVDRFVNAKAKDIVHDLTYSMRFKKYLNSLIKEMVREELDYKKGELK